MHLRGLSISRALPMSMAVVAVGTVVAQLINILGFMIATRFLGPAEFGVFGIHMAVSTPLALLATGRYEVAFIRAGRLVKVANLFALSIFVSVVFMAATAVVLVVVLEGTSWGQSISIPLICALLLGQSMVNCTTELNNYNRSYYLIAAARIAGAIGAQITVGTLAWSGMGHYALGVGMSLGFLVSIILSLAGNSIWLRTGLRTVSLTRIHVLARRNFSYILFTGPQALSSAFQESAALAVITAFFGQTAAGIYVLSNRLMRGPISIVAESVGRVLQRQIGDMASDECDERARFLRVSILYLSAVAIVFCLGVWALARPIVSMIFSPEWAPLSDLVRASAPYYAIYLVAAALALIPLATGNYKRTAMLGTIGSIVYVLLLSASGMFKTDLAEAFGFVSVGMLIYFLTFIYSVYRSVVRR